MIAPVARFLTTKSTSGGMSAAPKEHLAPVQGLRPREPAAAIQRPDMHLVAPAACFHSRTGSSGCLPCWYGVSAERASRQPHSRCPPAPSFADSAKRRRDPIAGRMPGEDEAIAPGFDAGAPRAHWQRTIFQTEKLSDSTAISTPAPTLAPPVVSDSAAIDDAKWSRRKGWRRR
jgi:hypothetical protein